MGIKLTRIGATLALALALAACGGGGGKGDKAEDNRSSYEKLVAMPQELDAAMMAVTSPIDSVDGILAQLGELPGKTKLTKEALGELISARFQGKPFAAPEGMDAAAATELDTFLGSLDTFKNNIMASPENAKALVMKVGESIVSVPVLAGKVAAESGVALASPFASKAEKAKAKTEKEGADKAKNDTLAAIEKAKGTATGLPARATAAVGKFIGGLGDFGVTDAVMGTVDDSKKAAEDAVDDTKKAVTE